MSDAVTVRVRKKGASAFFGTNLSAILVSQRGQPVRIHARYAGVVTAEDALAYLAATAAARNGDER